MAVEGPLFDQAKTRLHELYLQITKNIGGMLQSKVVFQHGRAFKPGIEEFIEAASFYYYLKFGTLVSLPELQGGTFLLNESETFDEKDVNWMKSLLTPTDYILGVADLTGELMRRCISSTNLKETNVLRNVINEAFMVLTRKRLPSARDFKQKCYTLKASLQKVDKACFLRNTKNAEMQNYSARKRSRSESQGEEDKSHRLLENAPSMEQDITPFSLNKSLVESSDTKISVNTVQK